MMHNIHTSLSQIFNQAGKRQIQEDLLMESIDELEERTQNIPVNEMTVRVVSKYGNDLIYPVDHKAHIFAQLLGQATLTRTNIKYIKALGFEIHIKYDEVKL